MSNLSSLDEMFADTEVGDAHDTPAAALAEAKQADPEPRQTQLVQRWRVDALKPNEHNADLFPDSLSEGSIELLAAELKERGLKVPIRVRPDGVVIDGERRWRAAKTLEWDMIDVLVEDVPDEDMLATVLAFARAARQLTLREQVYSYRAHLEQLKREAGRSQGRPTSKSSPEGEEYLAPQEIRSQAAAAARFGSARHAERAEAVFARAPADLLEQVILGEISVTAAYAKIPKQERAKPAKQGSTATAEPREPNSTFNDLGVGVPTHANPFDVLPKDSGSATSVSEQPTTASPQPRSEQGAAAVKLTPAVQTRPFPDPHPADHSNLEQDEEEEPALDPSEHLDALCAHLEQLRAGEDGDQLSDDERYEAARYAAEILVERLWAAVGEPPEPLEDEEETVVEEEDENFLFDQD